MVAEPDRSEVLAPPPPPRDLAERLGHVALRLSGWRVVGARPTAPRFVMIVAPHTSNWDGVILILTALALRVRLYWLGKHTLFEPPFGSFVRWLGGIPIDRTSSHNAVEQAVQWFNRQRQAVLVIAPEGTRHKTTRWKTGFYHIAQGANVPLVLGFMDYRRKAAGIGPVIEPSGDIEADMQVMQAFYRGITGRHSHRMSDVTLG